jgi:hypothetical protein
VGASSIDCHDCVFPGERHRVALTRVFVEFRTPSEGPRDHETLHHVIVLELMSDGVCVVWVGLLEEPLEVVCRRPLLTLVAVLDGRDTPHVGATCLTVVAVVVVGHGHVPLRALLAPLLAALEALLGAVDGDVGQHILAIAWGRLPASLGMTKFSRLVAGGVLGGDTAQLLNGVPENVDVFALTWVSRAAFG